MAAAAAQQHIHVGAGTACHLKLVARARRPEVQVTRVGVLCLRAPPLRLVGHERQRAVLVHRIDGIGDDVALGTLEAAGSLEELAARDALKVDGVAMFRRVLQMFIEEREWHHLIAVLRVVAAALVRAEAAARVLLEGQLLRGEHLRCLPRLAHALQFRGMCLEKIYRDIFRDGAQRRHAPVTRRDLVEHHRVLRRQLQQERVSEIVRAALKRRSHLLVRRKLCNVALARARARRERLAHVVARREGLRDGGAQRAARRRNGRCFCRARLLLRRLTLRLFFQQCIRYFFRSRCLLHRHRHLRVRRLQQQTHALVHALGRHLQRRQILQHLRRIAIGHYQLQEV